MATNLPFAPMPGSTTKITANATPTSVSGNLAAPGAATRIRVFNAGTVFVFLRLSTSGPAPVVEPMRGAGEMTMSEQIARKLRPLAISSQILSAVCWRKLLGRPNLLVM
jgi:hypothetical protein